MSVQTPVPTSITDWCISALTRSCSCRLPFSMISVWMCERRSNGHRIDGLVFLLDAEREGRAVSWLSLQQRVPAIASPVAAVASALRTASSATAFDDPVEVVVADRVQVGVGRGIHEVDGVRNAVLDRELDGVQVVAERAAQRERVALDARRAAPDRRPAGSARSARGTARADRTA